MQRQTYHFKDLLYQALLIDNRLGVIVEDVSRLLNFPEGDGGLLHLLETNVDFSEGTHYAFLTQAQVEDFNFIAEFQESGHHRGLSHYSPAILGESTGAVLYDLGVDALPAIVGRTTRTSVKALVPHQSLHPRAVIDFTKHFRWNVRHDIVWNWATPSWPQGDDIKGGEEDALPTLPEFGAGSDPVFVAEDLERIGDKLLEAKARPEGIDALVAAVKALAPEADIRRVRGPKAGRRGRKRLELRGILHGHPNLRPLSELEYPEPKVPGPVFVPGGLSLFPGGVALGPAYLSKVTLGQAPAGGGPRPRKGDRIIMTPRACEGRPEAPEHTMPASARALFEDFFRKVGHSTPDLARRFEDFARECSEEAGKDILLKLAKAYINHPSGDIVDWRDRLLKVGISPGQLGYEDVEDALGAIKTWLLFHVGTVAEIGGVRYVLAEGQSDTATTNATFGWVKDEPGELFN